MTVKQLRQAGFKVRVHHSRFHKVTGELQPAHFFRHPDHPAPHWMSPKGGLTEVQITTTAGQELRGKAECSKKDGFNRKLGLRIAIQRAFKAHNT